MMTPQISDALRVVLFFAMNLDEELTSDDICLKFGIESRRIWDRLKSSHMSGLLDSTKVGDTTVWSAGPTLKRIHRLGE